jgi:tetratricopeptide (TPR) repeat protein
MKQKIEWYREVLDLEPGSRVFFPLAKLLAADGQTTEAVNALSQGLLRHPDHVEARLLLAELLHLQNDEARLHQEIESLGSIFALYPGFWEAWSEVLADTPAFHDAALAMRFFSAALQGKSVSWSGVIEHGLHSVLGEAMPVMSSTGIAPHIQAPQEPVVAPSAGKGPSGRRSTATTSEELGVYTDEDAAIYQDAVDDEDSEEAFSIRTRSMAEVLAEQGDIAGALDIFHELVKHSSDEEKNSLEARIEELSTRMHAQAPAENKTEEKAVGPASPGPGEESGRLVNLLESLAQRLEDRAR